MTTTLNDFIATLATEDDALEAINAIRARFDLAGTMFCTADVTETAREAIGEDHPDLADALVAALTERVKGTYYWRKLGDIMSERGSETIADAVAETCHPLTSDDAEYSAHLCIMRGGQLVTAVEGLGFRDAQVAYTWAAGHLGSQVSTVLESRPKNCDLHVPTSALLHGTIEGVALVATTDDDTKEDRVVITYPTEEDA